MRVISGTARGKTLRSPANRAIRPTTDRIKEALFSILYSMAGPLDGMTVLDLFAGSGALGIEAMSRGAAHCLFVDSSRDACRLIDMNLAATGLADRSSVWCMPAAKALTTLAATGRSHDLIFLDPPYGTEELTPCLWAISDGAGVSESALLVVETSSRDEMICTFDNLVLSDRRRYGTTALSFYHYQRPH
jgi:16S rRNA (guanine(966)-N(2))-methyltransferase RsmD